MPIDPNDWRLQGQEHYLNGRCWTRKLYRKYQPDWDHDHCSFCWAKLMEPETPDTLHEGYSTQDDYYWVCPACFTDFQEMFQWTVANPRT
jgi:hypothetical protein